MVSKKKSSRKRAAKLQRRQRASGFRKRAKAAAPKRPASGFQTRAKAAAPKASLASFWSDFVTSPAAANTLMSFVATLAKAPAGSVAASALATALLPSSDELGTRLSAIETPTKGEGLKPMPLK